MYNEGQGPETFLSVKTEQVSLKASASALLSSRLLTNALGVAVDRVIALSLTTPLSQFLTYPVLGTLKEL